MLPILRRLAVSLLACGVLFAGYTFVVVPVIEPAVTRRDAEDNSTAGPSSTAPAPANRFEPLLAQLFPPEAWQVQRPKVAEDDGFVFLFRDFQQYEDGRVELKPCTLLVFSRKDLETDDVTRLLPTVVTADEGAILQFESGMAAKSGRFGRFQSGRLPGEVRVTRPESTPGAGDALSFTTRNIQIDMQKIWTPHDVQFRYGASYGSGRDLVITLLPPDKENGGSQSLTSAAIDGIKFIELVHLDKLHLEMPRTPSPAAGSHDGVPLPTSSARRPDLFSSAEDAPVEITCQGSFRMDVQERVAAFDDRVEVVRLRGDGPSDQLTCQLLTLHFFRPSLVIPAVPQSTTPPRVELPGDPTISAQIPEDPRVDDETRDETRDETGPGVGGLGERGFGERVEGGSTQSRYPARQTMATSETRGEGRPTSVRRPMFEVERIVATGTPVILHASSVGAQARGERLEYNVARRLLHLEDSREAYLEQSGQRIEAPQLQYELGEDPSRLGRAWAAGPGKLTRVDGSGASFETSWGEELRLRPQDDLHVLSLRGGTAIRMPGFGQFEAHVLHAWLREVPAANGKNSVAPDRMLAQGNVRFDSPRISGSTQELQAWFEPVDPNGSNVAERSAAGTGGASGYGGTGPGRTIAYGANPMGELSQPKTNVTGDLLRIQVLQAGERSLLDRLSVKGHVIVTETGPVESEEGRLRIDGNELSIDDADTDKAVLRITGIDDEPAQVRARGLTLIGHEIRLSQIENRMWIDGGGEMTLPPIEPRPKARGNVLFENSQPFIPQVPSGQGRDANERTSRPLPFTITWKGRMDFDGQLARFQKDVRVRGTHKLDSGEVLELIVLGGLLDVSLTQRLNFGGAAPPDDIALGQLTFGGHIYIEGQTTQSGQVTAKHKMQIHNLSLDQTTGRLHGDGPGWLSSVRLDHGQFASAAGLSSGVGGAGKNVPGESRLLFLHVEFSRELNGNANARHIEFSDQVQTIFGPVTRWDEELDWRNPDSAGEQGATLRCERLAVGQMPGSSPDSPSFELEAHGSAIVEGQKFLARASRITYSQAKDQLIFAGDGRADAEFFRKPRSNPLKPDTVARTIMYWRRENRLEISGGKYIDLSPYASELRQGQRPRP